MDRSNGKIRADVAFDKLRALGFSGSERTTRRAVADAKANYRHGRRRVYRPWIAEPGLWAQWDWGQGPTIGGRGTNLFCAWLGWSRTRVVFPTWDRTSPTVIGSLDRAMRAFGGAPTYWLTDNEKTVTVDHVARRCLGPLSHVNSFGAGNRLSLPTLLLGRQSEFFRCAARLFKRRRGSAQYDSAQVSLNVQA